MQGFATLVCLVINTNTNSTHPRIVSIKRFTLSFAASSCRRAAAWALAALKNASVEGDKGSADSSMEDNGDRAPRFAEGAGKSASGSIGQLL